MSGVACSPQDEQSGPPTWHADVAPLVAEHCGGCHVDGGPAPFALDDYSTAASFANSLTDAVEAELMPPWGAIESESCQPPHGFMDDPRLDAEQRQLLADWADAGAPEGDPATAAPVPDPPSLDLEAPDAIVDAQTAYTVAGTGDQWVCFSFDPKVDQDVWVTGLQVIPGDARVFHHAITFVDPAAQSVDLGGEDGLYPCYLEPGLAEWWGIGAYLPGAPPTRPPPDVGIPLPAGSRLVLSVHYHPLGGDPISDRPSIALQWRDEIPPYVGHVGNIGNFNAQFPDGTGLQPGPGDPPEGPAFVVPAGAPDHTETLVWRVPEELPGLKLWSIGTHMHFSGTSMRIELSRPSEESACLLETPRWDPSWQRLYTYDASFDQLPVVGGGDELRMQCTYDNTLDNPILRRELEAAGHDAPFDMPLGEDAFDEMCLAFLGVAWEASASPDIGLAPALR